MQVETNQERFETASESLTRLDAYSVKVPVFEGPLDLLLHLIRINEVEITDIPIATIGEQYLEYVSLMQELNLDVAGDYLVMAATLAWIKSRMLLPPDGTDEGFEADDPRAELVARLLEYQRFKEVAAELGERNWLGRDVFPAAGAEPDEDEQPERELEAGLFELIEAYRRVLTTVRHTGRAHLVEREAITVRQCMLDIFEAMKDVESIEFAEVVSAISGGVPSVSILVASFLAILELTRLDVVTLYQGTDDRGCPSGSIYLRHRPGAGADEWKGRIADVD
ncbi:segregation/condensation protein A [Myxococcota bacterium]|nr:segregation/condensation protein A [Myxococcota bacterium]